MAVISPNEFRSSDVLQYIPYAVGAVDPSAKGIALTASKTGHIKLAVFAFPVKVIDIQVVCSDGAVVALTSFTASYGPVATLASASLGTALSAATLPVVSSATSLPITTSTYGDTALPPTIPAGLAIGVDYSTPVGSTVALVGFILRYRPMTNVI